MTATLGLWGGTIETVDYRKLVQIVKVRKQIMTDEKTGTEKKLRNLADCR
jgi:hypothetical protein